MLRFETIEEYNEADLSSYFPEWMTDLEKLNYKNNLNTIINVFNSRNKLILIKLLKGGSGEYICTILRLKSDKPHPLKLVVDGEVIDTTIINHEDLEVLSYSRS